MKQTIVILCLGIACCNADTTIERQSGRTFPEDFIFGTATASYQVEGAWNEDEKGESIWDRLTHTQSYWIKDQSTGDVATDSYHNVERDVEMMRELGLDAYRFSLSWSRLLPSGFADKVNEAGVNYYNNLINEMLKYNIEPMITLYHWDLPQPLQDLGGWTNSLITTWFEDYARVAYENFGDRVKFWITFNEPKQICYWGYGAEGLAPVLNATGIGDYLCVKNLLVSHAKAYHLYVNDFKSDQGGEVGITININWFEATSDSEEDKFAAEIYRQGEWAIYADPIFSDVGGFPKELSQRIAEKSAEQGYPRSRLPELTEEEKGLVHGSSDFLGINHYTAYLVSASDNYKSENAVPSLLDDIGFGAYKLPEWSQSASSWLQMAPNSVYYSLSHLHTRYNNVPMYVTENGWSTRGGLEDDDRVTYYRNALEDVLDLLDDGVQIKGYMAWSLMDNFEWMQGYTERFGLYEVDFEDPARTRTPRKSAFVYKEIVRTRTIDHLYEPQDKIITIDEGH